MEMQIVTSVEWLATMTSFGLVQLVDDPHCCLATLDLMKFLLLPVFQIVF